MTTPLPDRPAPPEALALDADVTRLREALRRNTVYLAAYGLLSVAVVAGIVALAVTEVGRLATFFLLGLLLVILLASVVRGLRLRARVRTYLDAPAPLLLLSPSAIAFSGIPPIPWADVLGVVFCDERANLARGGGFARWSKRVVYGAGGSQVTLHVGVDSPQRFRAGASGGLTRYLSSAFDLGGLTLTIDTALNDGQLQALRDALRAAETAGIVRYLETDDPRRVARAAGLMATGRPMPRDV